MSYWKNKQRKRLLTFVACLTIVSILFSLNLKTVYAQPMFGFSNNPDQLAAESVAASTSVFDHLKGALKLAVLAPFLPIYAFIAGILLPAANTLFVWAVKVDNFRAVVGSPAIYTSWKIVRDFLNIAFILVILFSAFATIFQVEKYSYKKILLNLVLMALLVNFSFPIARFIIDLSNVLMYTLMNMLFEGGQAGAGKALAMIADKAGISSIMDPKGSVASSVAAMLAAIIFGFILAITMVAIGIMFVIRIVALAILIIFSPVAFVASIIPATASYASDWWNQLFKYAFFGPIMIFMIYIAVTTMQSFASVQTGFSVIAGSESMAPNLIGNIAYLAIPIVILWIGMGTAQKMSIAGAGAVMGGAQKILKSFGSKYSGVDAVKRGYKAYEARRDAHHKGDIFERAGTGIGSAGDRMRTLIGSDRSKREAQNRLDQDQMNREKKAYESHNMGNMEPEQLRQLMEHGTADEMAAATRALAEKGNATGDDLDKVRDAFGETSQVFRQLVNKVKDYDPGAAFAHIADGAAREKAIANAIEKGDVTKYSADAWKGHRGQELARIGFEKGLLDTKTVGKITDKSTAHEDALKRTLTSLSDISTNHGLASHREIQLARLAQTGKMSAHAETGATSADWQREIFSRGNADTFKNMKASYVATHAASMAQHINSGEYKEIVTRFKDKEAKKELNGYVGTTTFPTGAAGENQNTLQGISHNDPYLRNIV